MTEAMRSEFDTVPVWTAEAVRDLGESYAVPAACRGSGTPAALDWLLDRLLVDDRAVPLLDVGGGMGGPAAFARDGRGVRPVVVDLSVPACAAARAMFRLPALAAAAERVPMRDNAFRAAWCLGTICTTRAQQELVDELARLLEPGGRVGTLTLVRAGEVRDGPSGNRFPTWSEVEQLHERAGLQLLESTPSADLPAAPTAWRDAEAEVEQWIVGRHGADPRHAQSVEQEERLGALLESGSVRGFLTVAERR